MQFALLIFCLLTIVGAFSAWRKSPLYSLKTTFNLVGGFLLIAAVAAGTSLAIVNGPAESLADCGGDCGIPGHHGARIERQHLHRPDH